jgi:hypothetical protein
MPDLAYDDIPDGDRLVVTLDTQFLAFGVGGQRLERHQPDSVTPDRGFDNLFGELDGHLVPPVRPAPNLNWPIPLKHHVVREDTGHANVA